MYTKGVILIVEKTIPCLVSPMDTSLIIFKGVRLSDDFQKDTIQGNVVKLLVSPLHSPARPFVLLMDSHSSHVTDDFVINTDKENDIYLFTFPSHTTHLLQPLDVGVYRPFKLAWGKSLNNYMARNPNQEPNKTNFHALMKPVCFRAFSPENILSSFQKTGISPLDREVIPGEAIYTSRLTEKPQKDKIQASPDDTDSVLVSQTRKEKGLQSKMFKFCSDGRTNFCMVWYHTKCQATYSELEDVFMCDGCTSDSDDED
ncbi:hypothetical protein PR048_013037 [Dryococelus australis]|uniref:DDE-1 domain-containing protein n=1 Tax=Dryococelus australis TaxID=614101 RepID=A0ABQ9HRR6_9NEOP|nr:hypothetical protein PR048_013037 [Dryococelus australis]